MTLTLQQMTNHASIQRYVYIKASNNASFLGVTKVFFEWLIERLYQHIITLIHMGSQLNNTKQV